VQKFKLPLAIKRVVGVFCAANYCKGVFFGVVFCSVYFNNSPTANRVNKNEEIDVVATDIKIAFTIKLATPVDT
jgi:hypothetical protein